MNLPKRSPQHRIETDSINLLKIQLGSNWVFRDQQDRDYGIDVHLELFDNDTPTGLILYGQLKGTDKAFESEDVILKNFPTKTANYGNLFGIPFFVFFISIPSQKIKFIWLQEYLRLNVTQNQLLDQKSITIEFPQENTVLGGHNEKIKEILEQEKLYKSALKFITYYERLSSKTLSN